MTTEIMEEVRFQVASMKTSCEISRKGSHVAILKETDGTNSISLYQGNIAEPNEIAVAMTRLKAAFPKMDGTFFNLLAERLIDNCFSSKRLKDAINDTIDNFRYKELAVADIIKFDRRLKLYTYNDVCRMVSKGECDFSDFEKREINGEFYRVKKTDLIER